MTFHDDKALEPLVAEKWEDFNMKINTTIPEILQWVSERERERELLRPFLGYKQVME